MAEYITREVLLAQLRAMESYNASPMYRRGYDDCVATVLKAPAADVVPVVHGRWIQLDEDIFACSKCRSDWAFSEEAPHEMGLGFCPCCGAKMDEEDEND